jgi:diguanylate cyclase (GGDEF)-like protein
VTTLHATGHAAFVVGPPDVRLMRVTIAGRRSLAGSAMPVGSSRLGHVVPAVPVPASVPAGTPILVEVVPAGAGAPQLLTDDPTYDTAIDASRWSGVVIGVLLAVLLLQIAMYAFTRDPSIPFFVGVVATFAAIELLREHVITFEPALPPLVGVMLLDIVNGLCDIAFTVVYLRLWRDARKLFWVLTLGVTPTTILAIAAVAIPALHPVVEPIRAFCLCFGIAVLLAVTAARMRAFPPARYLFVALGMLALNLVYRLARDMTNFGMPQLDHWFFEVSEVCDVMIFGLAVIGRSRYLVRERRILEHQLDEATHAAEHDVLTGALNRRGLMRAVRTMTSGTLFFLDLDGFKAINDRYGHATGDEVLRSVVALLYEVAGDDAIVARVGGDEFVVVVAGEGRPEAERLAGLIGGAFAQRPGERRGTAVSASVGYAPLSGLTLENAMRIADTNAYRAKTLSQTVAVDPA